MHLVCKIYEIYKVGYSLVERRSENLSSCFERKRKKYIIKKWKDIINPFNNFKAQDIGTMVQKKKTKLLRWERIIKRYNNS